MTSEGGKQNRDWLIGGAIVVGLLLWGYGCSDGRGSPDYCTAVEIQSGCL